MDDEEAEVGASGQVESGFKPREDLIEIIMTLGFSRNAAIKGLFYTGNFNAELAAGWLFENQDKNLDGPLEDDLEGSEDDSDIEYMGSGDFYKMVFVVNCQLEMGVGKIAAQVAHAALNLHRKLLSNQQTYGQMLLSWEQYGETKIVLKGENSAQLADLAAVAAASEVPYYIVEDAGKTQIAPGSTTVLGIMGKVEAVDQITGKLKLL
ncbi:probable peptidyl-tRNA hydrolase 2 isoform X2 [Gigantopelta aegis]|nr:probable peptidyl-tRNA hydrolase 2 isoform X2 [Gigantopelta aegis]XP_041360744.1 probable peptidyl-tRNA hydrolase 2 isoform X2 [Gigantopelta aegis]